MVQVGFWVDSRVTFENFHNVFSMNKVDIAILIDLNEMIVNFQNFVGSDPRKLSTRRFHGLISLEVNEIAGFEVEYRKRRL